MRQDHERDLKALRRFTRSHQSYEWCLQPLDDLLVKVLVIFGQMEEDFHCAEDHGRASMLKSVFEEIHDVEFLLLVRRVVLRGNVQNDTLSPLVEVFYAVQEWDDKLPVNVDSALVCQYLVHCLDGVDDDERVLVTCQRVNSILKISLFECTFVEVVEFYAADDCCLFYVRIGVVEALGQRVLHVFMHSIKFQGAERSQGQASYLVIRRLQVHLECVNGQDGQLGILLRVIDKVKVNHFLGDDVAGLGGFDHLWVQPRDIDSKCHVGNYFFDHVLLLGWVLVNIDRSKQPK